MLKLIQQVTIETQKHTLSQSNGNTYNKTRAKNSYGTCDEARRAKSQELIWYEL